MKKEVIIAIIIGISLGLVITFGVRTAQQSLNQPLETPQPSPSLIGPNVVESPKHTLFIASPQKNAIIESEKIQITGSTTPYSLVALYFNEQYATTMADIQGNFTQSFNSKNGVSKIQVASYSDTGETANSSTFLIKPAPEKPIELPSPSAPAKPTPTPKISPTSDPTASPGAQTEFDIIKENVKKRIQDVVNNKTELPEIGSLQAIIGHVQSQADSTLTINDAGATKLASISGETKILQAPNFATLTREDIALDSFVGAIGPSTSESVIDVKQLIIEKNPPTNINYQTVFGQLVSYDPKTFYLILMNPADQTQTKLLISRKATLRQAQTDDTTKTLARNSVFPDSAFVLVIYLPQETATADNVAYDVILKTNPL